MMGYALVYGILKKKSKWAQGTYTRIFFQGSMREPRETGPHTRQYIYLYLYIIHNITTCAKPKRKETKKKTTTTTIITDWNEAMMITYVLMRVKDTLSPWRTKEERKKGRFSRDDDRAEESGPRKLVYNISSFFFNFLVMMFYEWVFKRVCSTGADMRRNSFLGQGS